MTFLNVKDGRVKSNTRKGQKLTPKMLSFINAYFGDAQFNGIRAMELSDYKCTTKTSLSRTYTELMNHPLVIEEITKRQARIKVRDEKRQEIREFKNEVKAEYLINKLLTMIEENQENNPNVALRAIELAGKSIALWKERQEISGPDGNAIKHEQEVKESVADFTSRISSLVKRGGETNIVEFPKPQGAGGT